jgi:hypothetical protein
MCFLDFTGGIYSEKDRIDNFKVPRPLPDETFNYLLVLIPFLKGRVVVLIHDK